MSEQNGVVHSFTVVCVFFVFRQGTMQVFVCVWIGVRAVGGVGQ